jgi:probable phosphoglycerate mutase
VQTAVPLSILTGVPIETDPLLLEIGHGTWEGRYRDEIARSEPVLYREWREHPERVRFDGGESLHDVLERWKTFVREFEPRGDTMLMTHDVVVRLAVLERTGRGLDELRDVRALNAAYAEFEVEGSQWTLRRECVADHLADLAADPERQAL